MNTPLNLTTGQKVDVCCYQGPSGTGRKIPVTGGTVERLTKTRAIVRNDNTGNLSAYRLSDGGRVGGGDYCITASPVQWTAKDDGEGVKRLLTPPRERKPISPMKKTKYRALGGASLSALGVKYHAFGTLRHSNSRRVYGYFFKADCVTSEQRAELQSGFTAIEFKSSSPAYAPEIRSALIVQLSRAEIARKAKRTADSRTPFTVKAQAFHESRTNPGAARVAMQRSEADLRGNPYLMAD